MIMPLKWYILGPIISILGVVLAIPAMGLQEMGYGWYIGPFVAAPIIEEAAKPAGVYWLLSKKPHALPSQRYTAFLAALAGLSFGLVESIIYVTIYIPDHSQAVFVWRFSICLLLHTVCSCIVGFGINEKLVAWVRGEVRLLKGNRKYFFGAMAIHSCYNMFAWFVETELNWFPD